MIAILEDQYFQWLYSHIQNPSIKRPNKTYWGLARQLHNKEFIYTVSNDDNRWADGRALRNEFLDHWEDTIVSESWLGLDCSMLEMLIALSRRLEFQTDEPALEWFWILMKNVDLAQFTDAVYDEEARHLIDHVLNRIIWRRYSFGGVGGLFPLERADRDQRQLELWFQMHMYLLEHSF